MAQQKNNPAQMYEDYLVPGIHARWAPLLLAYAQPSPGDRVLDVACGTGIVCRHLASAVGESGRVVGLDINPDMLAVAQNLPRPQGATIEWHQGDATSLPPGPFDLITCQQGLQFFPERLKALQQMRQALAPGGRLAVSVFRDLSHHPVFEALLRAEAGYLDLPVEDVATPFSLGDADTFHRLLEDAGFRSIQVTQETRTARFPSPDTFVALTLQAAASFVPGLSEDEAERQRLIETVSERADDVVRQYVENGAVTFPMHAHLAVAAA